MLFFPSGILLWNMSANLPIPVYAVYAKVQNTTGETNYQLNFCAGFIIAL